MANNKIPCLDCTHAELVGGNKAICKLNTNGDMDNPVQGLPVSQIILGKEVVDLTKIERCAAQICKE